MGLLDDARAAADRERQQEDRQAETASAYRREALSTVDRLSVEYAQLAASNNARSVRVLNGPEPSVWLVKLQGSDEWDHGTTIGVYASGKWSALEQIEVRSRFRKKVVDQGLSPRSNEVIFARARSVEELEDSFKRAAVEVLRGQ